MTASSSTLDAVLSRLEKLKRDARGYTARCPAHGDKESSLSVGYADGKVLLRCFAGCEFEQIVSALGLKPQDMFADKSEETRQVRKVSTCTLAELAETKKLPAEFLRGLGWKDGRGTMIAYEPDRGALAAQERYAFVVEGETDVATLLNAGFPAIGIPGASATKVLDAEHVAGLERVFVVQEPDSAGEKFVTDIKLRLGELAFAGAVHVFKTPDTAKDPCALWQRDQAAFAQKLNAEMAKLMAPPEPAWRWLSDAIPSLLKPVGARLATSFQTLDEATRGGIPMGRFVVLAGAPGSSKTTLSVYLANRWERGGATVVYLAADEPPEGIAMRFGQLAGWSREGLEEEGAIGDSTRAGFAERLRGRRIVVVDPDKNNASIEDAAAALAAASTGPLRVLIVDSLQTARCAASQGLESARERMDATVQVCKRIARTGVLVLAISEMSRAGYSGKDTVSALAASKESGSIEYGVSLLLGLRTAKDVQGQFDVEVAKNRLGGSKPSLRLRLDFATAALSEISAPAAPVAQGGAADQAEYLEAVRKVLAAARHPLSANTIIAVSEKQRQGVQRAVASLEYAGELTKHRNGYWLASRGSPPE
jgi:KaiC/GvpD/RAD55 family RecA-like ATPase